MKDSLEAPAVIYTYYKDKDGWEFSLTLRDDSGTDALSKMASAKKFLLSEGCTPLPLQKSFSKGSSESKPTKECSYHPGEMMKQNKNGKWYHTRGVYPDLDYCNGNGFRDHD